MQHQEGYVTGVRGTRIYQQAWLPDGPPKAVVIIVHGLTGHSGRHASLVNHLLPRRYAVYAYDNLGHGRSEGTRAHVQHFDDFISTLASYVKQVRLWQPSRQLILFGHSMGGLISTRYLPDYQDRISAAILSAPSIKSASVSPATGLLVRLLSALVPKVRVGNVPPEALSRDPAVAANYRRDPLTGTGRYTARLGAEVLSAMRTAVAEADRITLPLLVLQGDSDRIVDPEATRLLYERVSSTDKTLRLYAGLYHEVCNEPERGEVLADIEAWLEARIP